MKILLHFIYFSMSFGCMLLGFLILDAYLLSFLGYAGGNTKYLFVSLVCGVISCIGWYIWGKTPRKYWDES